MISLIAIIFTFSVVIFVHELGHFIVALKSGVHVEVFSLGFGPELIGFTLKEVRYRISAIPLGGYVKMKGESAEDESAREPGSFMNLSPLKRIPILASGAVMNFITGAVIIFFIIYTMGMTRFINEPVIGGVEDDTPAMEAGFMPGDRVLSIEGTEITTWNELAETVRARGGEETEFTVQRDGEILQIEAVPVPESERVPGRGALGITSSVEVVRPGFFRSILESLLYVVSVCLMLIEFLWMMFTGRMAAEVSGPLGIGKAVADAASHGISPLFQLIALISVQLGLLNLFPVPILDGGHILMALIEKIKGSALDPKKVMVANLIGVTLLLSLLLFATWQDALGLLK